MKKIIALAAASLVCFAAFGQSFTVTDGEITAEAPSGPKVFDFQTLSSFGWGYHIMKDGDADFLGSTPKFGKNREIFFTLAELVVKPVKAVSLNVGVDLNWDAYRLNSNYYWKPGGAQDVAIADMSPDYTQIKKSVLRSFGFDLPVQLRINIGNFSLSGGIVGEYNLPGRTKFKAIDASGVKVKNGALRVKDIEARPFTWSYRASISYNSLGLYFKYNPVSQFAEGKGPQFSNYTVGLMIW